MHVEAAVHTGDVRVRVDCAIIVREVVDVRDSIGRLQQVAEGVVSEPAHKVARIADESTTLHGQLGRHLRRNND